MTLASDSSILIRPANADDAAAVAACVCSAYLHYIERIGKQPGPMLEDYAAVISQHQVHVALQDTAVVGAIVLKRTDEGFYVDNVAVRPSVQGQGVGRKLLQLAESEARRQGYVSIFLATHERMEENRDLYSRIGYVLYDHRLVNGCPRVFFRKLLSEVAGDIPATRFVPGFAPETVLRSYFRAKDENRPHVMSKVFSQSATLRMHVKTDAISFPAESIGLDAITDVLVRKFGQTYENVYSFYLERPPVRAERFSCQWLVGMTEKSNGNVRVGCGGYQWEFDAEASGLARRLTVTIEAMQTLPPAQFAPVFAWLGALSYPWSSAAAAAAAAPAIEALAPVIRYLGARY